MSACLECQDDHCGPGESCSRTCCPCRTRPDMTLPAPRVLVIDEVVPPGVMPRGMWRGSSVTWAAADLVVDRTGRVLKWRYGPTGTTR